VARACMSRASIGRVKIFTELLYLPLIVFCFFLLFYFFMFIDGTIQQVSGSKNSRNFSTVISNEYK